jgi:hypothetical protein
MKLPLDTKAPTGTNDRQQVSSSSLTAIAVIPNLKDSAMMNQMIAEGMSSTNDSSNSHHPISKND